MQGNLFPINSCLAHTTQRQKLLVIRIPGPAVGNIIHTRNTFSLIPLKQCPITEFLGIGERIRLLESGKRDQIDKLVQVNIRIGLHSSVKGSQCRPHRYAQDVVHIEQARKVRCVERIRKVVSGGCSHAEPARKCAQDVVRVVQVLIVVSHTIFSSEISSQLL